jgi:threonine aldolase
LARHLDGARLFNAVVASGIAAKEWGRLFDTISVCFSKGLGAPVGSALVGTRDHIKQARRLRKALGGGWRQAGLLAAAASYALDHHVDRLAEDHANAQILADAIRQSDSLRLVPPQVDTNIVIFEIEPRLGTAPEFCRKLGEHGVGVYPFGKQRVRAVMHLDVSAEQITHAAEILLELSE